MKSKTSFTLPCIVLVLLMAGCASTKNYKKAQDTSHSLKETAQVINESNAQSGVVTRALGSLVESPASDIKLQFKKFDSELTKLDSLANDVYAQSTAIQAEGDAYFRSWDEELATIKNEKIRSRSTERRKIMAERFEEVRISYEQAKGELTLFVYNLKDIRTALATDLTSDGLKSVEDVTEDSKDRARQLQKTLSRLEVDFKDLSASMSTAARY